MLDQRPARLTPGELLANRYRLQDAIERAGFGHAWRARDESSGRAVEVHDLATLRGGLDRGEAIARLRASAAVKHRALAATQEVFEHAGAVVVVAAPAEGQPLAAWMEEPARAGVAARLDAARAVIDQVAQGLWALHRPTPSLAHGCLGSACVRVAMRGVLPAVTVSAAGWTRVVAPPGWWVCPPEGEALTASADVFALGLLATELLTGASTLHHVDAVRRRFEDRLPEADATLVDGIAACLAVDPAHRLADARAARERLLHASVSWKARERPVVAPRPTAPRVEEAPVKVPTPSVGPQVWVTPAKVAVKPAVAPSAEETDESTQVEAPRRWPVPRPPPAAPPPPDDADEATQLEAPPVPPPPRASTSEPGDESTDVSSCAPEATEEATDPAPVEPEEHTNPIGAAGGAFAVSRAAREHTLVPGGRVIPAIAFVPDEPTAPMTSGANVTPGVAPLVGMPPISAPPRALPERTPPDVPAMASLGSVAPWVAVMVGVGALLGLVLWWAIR
ncbi:MAG: hypothetical protein U0324_16100 [Polyangiales bacterium]